MSALAQSPDFISHIRSLSEREALHLAGRSVWAATEVHSGLESLAAIALRVPGLHRVQFTLQSPESDSKILEWSVSEASAPCGSAMAALTANGHTHGRLRIFFEPRIHSLESPLRFARFLAQQSALLLNRIELAELHNSHLTRIAHLQQRLETRKVVHRAKGILAEMHGISEADALELLLRYAHQSRRGLKPLAEAIVLGRAI
jgi:AmiR/NasT family two-component response regulator